MIRSCEPHSSNVGAAIGQHFSILVFPNGQKIRAAASFAHLFRSATRSSSPLPAPSSTVQTIAGSALCSRHRIAALRPRIGWRIRLDQINRTARSTPAAAPTPATAPPSPPPAACARRLPARSAPSSSTAFPSRALPPAAWCVQRSGLMVATGEAGHRGARSPSTMLRRSSRNGAARQAARPGQEAERALPCARCGCGSR